MAREHSEKTIALFEERGIALVLGNVRAALATALKDIGDLTTMDEVAFLDAVRKIRQT